MSTNTLKLVTDFLADLTKDPFIDADEDLFERGVLTSLTAMAVVDWVETSFKIIIEGDDLNRSNLASAAAIASFVDLKIGGARFAAENSDA